MQEMNQQEFLAGYDQRSYDCPSIATDIAAFALRTRQGSGYRMDPEKRLAVLLIRRGEHPYQDHWALPGGFLHRSETIEECAFRELKEETNLEPVSMLWVDSFSQPGRDPRGWIVSHAFASIIAEEDAHTVGGSDAAEARWFEVSWIEKSKEEYQLLLCGGDVTLEAMLKPEISRTGTRRFSILENRGLAFDHAAILAGALETLRREGENMDTVFAFLPEKFTLTALQRVQETLLGITHLTPNFRRKAAEFVDETEEFTEGAGHRPARLYVRKGGRL